MKLKPWPTEEPTDEMVGPPDPVLEMRSMSDVEMAFPAQVSPDPMKSPSKYWVGGKVGTYDNSSDPWIRLASDLIHGALTAEQQKRLCMPTRTPGTGPDAWRWVRACSGSFQLKHEYKIVVVAWILESFFWAYWLQGEEPDWVLEQLTAPGE